MATMKKITPHLWFDNQAEQAVEFYTSVFKDSAIGKIARYGKEGFEIHGREAGSIMSVEFQIEGQEFLAINGGPIFKFNESVSFVINCETQEEVDYYWEKLTKDGDETAKQCGWLKDKFGLSWQVVPTVLAGILGDPDTEKSERAMKVFLQMKKIDIETLQQAYEGKGAA